METNLSRALVISDGSLAFLWERPLTLGIICVPGGRFAAVVLVLPPILDMLARKRASRGPEVAVSEGEG